MKNILVQGALATAGKYILNSWAITKRGPTYPTMFSPLSVVFTVVLDSVLLGNDITIGRSVAFICVYHACLMLQKENIFDQLMWQM